MAMAPWKLHRLPQSHRNTLSKRLEKWKDQSRSKKRTPCQARSTKPCKYNVLFSPMAEARVFYIICYMLQSYKPTAHIQHTRPWTLHYKLPSSVLAQVGFHHICKYIYTYIICFIYYKQITDGSLEVKLPTIWTDEKQRWKGSERRERLYRREKSRRERVRRKKMQMREQVGKSRNTVFFQWFVAPEGRKVGSLKWRVRSQLAKWEMKNCTPLWREARFQVKMSKHTTFGPLLEIEMLKKCAPLWREVDFEVKMYKTHQLRTTFTSCDVEKVHAVVARSTFPSQNVQHTRGADHFWQLRCRKSAHRRGAKHISKSKCTKHHMFAPLLEVQMSFRVAGARDCAPCQKWQKREGFVAFLPSCLNMRTSKTEQVCETSSFFELDHIRNEAILRDFLMFGSARHQKRSKTKNSARRPSQMESWVQSWQTRTNAFCDFSSPPV